MKFKYTLLYIVAIAIINWGFSVVPLVPVLGEMWPPMSLAVGLIFIARDYAQREVGHYVFLAMAAAGLLSWWMASPFIAVASLTAFTLSELMDWGFYTFTKKPFRDRVIISSLVSTPIDSGVFLLMIGHFSITGVIIMTASKLVGALILYRWIK
jgi:queuosine precursor transporter